MLISVVVINISSKRNSRRPLPWILKKTLDGDFGKFLGIERSPQVNLISQSLLVKQTFCTLDDEIVLN